jgi:hypothetical protein
MLLPLELLAVLVSFAAASPLPPSTPIANAGRTLPLFRNRAHPLAKRSTGSDLLEYTQREALKLRRKYSSEPESTSLSRRQSEGVALLSNLNKDRSASC